MSGSLSQHDDDSPLPISTDAEADAVRYDLVNQGARTIMEGAWRSAGYTSPNRATYPWMWLWDSCFHAIVWAGLADERAVTELASVFTWQHDDGFVPHMGYQSDPSQATDLWGRVGHSSITQPPMYAHAARVLTDAGYQLDHALLDRVGKGLDFFWSHRMGADGLVRILHPWESGADDSPRWDAWAPDPFDKAGFDRRKRSLVSALQESSTGSSVSSPDFSVAPAMFNAIVAFNAFEYATLTGSAMWKERGNELAAALDGQWDQEAVTWLDGGDHHSRSAPTSEALLGVLVAPHRLDAVWTALTDPAGFGAPFGPRNVDRRYPTYDPSGYWRGATWPQVNYLLWVATRHRPHMADVVARQTVRGAWESGFSEYWDPETGTGHGARPQSWTALALVMHPDHDS